MSKARQKNALHVSSVVYLHTRSLVSLTLRIRSAPRGVCFEGVRFALRITANYRTTTLRVEMALAVLPSLRVGAL